MTDTTPSTADERLAPLIGDWDVEGAHPVDASMQVRGRTSFKWLDGGRFVVQRWTVEHPDFPSGIAILGEGEAGFAQHYFDSRGVGRVYAMSLADGVWQLSREHPGFSQRFVGTFSDDGRTIDGRWEMCTDDSNWELDFHLRYTKAS
jgi:hypothetical protein